MKKLVALFLAALMLLSTAAFAATYTSTLTKSTNTYKYAEDVTTKGDIKTEVYLQVDASGQIDVTVPLYLLFKTNVDGGSKQLTGAYKITNNNTKTAIGLKKVVAADKANGTATLVAKSTLDTDLTVAGKKNEYAVVLAPKAEGTTVLVNSAATTMDLKTGTFKNDTNPADYLVWIDKSQSVDMQPTVATTALDFITIQNGSALDETKGLLLMEITYTVGLVYETTPVGTALPTADVVSPTEAPVAPPPTGH